MKIHFNTEPTRAWLYGAVRGFVKKRVEMSDHGGIPGYLEEVRGMELRGVVGGPLQPEHGSLVAVDVGVEVFAEGETSKDDQTFGKNFKYRVVKKMLCANFCINF